MTVELHTPLPVVAYVKHDADGNVLQAGTMSLAALEERVRNGEGLIVTEERLDPDKHKVKDGKVQPKTQNDARRAAKQIKEAEAAELAALSPQERRAVEYPPLSEFADAFYWSIHGDDKPLEKWLAAVDEVKATHPKEET